VRPISVTRDNQANDGAQFEQDDVHSDIERVLLPNPE
jgi:hypothetical protein